MIAFASSPRQVTWLAALALVCLPGCGSQSATNGPKTYPVRGVLLQADGQPAKGGNLEFTSKQPGGPRLFGTVGSDGQLTVRTVRAEGNVPGAPEGTYTVVFVPLASSQSNEQHLAAPMALREEFTVSATEDNNFTIRLPAK